MKKTIVCLSLQAFLLASTVQAAAPLNGVQKDFYDRLGITPTMEPKDRVRVCVAALKQARETKMTSEFVTGLGLIGTGITVRQFLGNSKPSRFNDFKNTLDRLAREKMKNLQSGEQPYSKLASEVKYFNGEYQSNLYTIQKIAREYKATGDRTVAVERLKQILKSSEAQEAAIATLLPKDFFSAPAEAQSRELEILRGNQASLSQDLTEALKETASENSGKLKKFFEHADSLGNGKYQYNEGVRSGQFIGFDYYEKEITSATSVIEERAANRTALVGKVGVTIALAGVVMELNLAYDSYKEAGKAKAGAYSIDSAASGPAVGICGKAAGDDYNPEAIESITRVIRFAAVPLMFKALDEAKASGAVTNSGNKTTH